LPLSSDEYHFFTFGLQAGFIQKSIDFSSGSGWGSQFNPSFGFDPSLPMDESQFNGKTIYPDLGVGVIWHNNAIKDYDTKKTSSYLGFSVQHLNTPDESLLINQSSRLPRLFRVHGGLEFRLSPHFRISPNVIALQQNQAYQFNGGVYLTYAAFEAKKGVMQEAAIVLGSWYRYGDAVIFSTGLNSRYYALGFSYDLNNSSLRYITHGKGAYEVSLSAKIFRAKNTPTEKTPGDRTPRFRR
jgi:type IX secretion system PorP/SprF family membrane protein